jgi:hypothetical protein
VCVCVCIYIYIYQLLYIAATCFTSFTSTQVPILTQAGSRLMSIAEEKCELETSVPADASSEPQSRKVSHTTSIELFSTGYSPPVYQCPQNTDLRK